MDIGSFIAYIKTKQLQLQQVLLLQVRQRNNIKFVILRPKTNSYLTDDNDENKKLKDTKKCVTNLILLQNRLEAKQLKKYKTNYQEQNKLDLDSLRETHKEFMKKK